ncbi:MAG: transposase [Candidatus Acidiferrales bacterium]
MTLYYERNLPHWHPPGQSIFLTWRLKGTLPTHLSSIPPKDAPGKRFLALDRALDRATAGPLWLQDPRVAECVVASLRNTSGHQGARVHAFTVMPNHIHVLLTPLVPVAQITRLIKGATARHANLLLGLTGNYFWQDESFDHWVRNPAEWQKIKIYIERNPVTAGLAATPEDWSWSSASHPIE